MKNDRSISYFAKLTFSINWYPYIYRNKNKLVRFYKLLQHITSDSNDQLKIIFDFRKKNSHMIFELRLIIYWCFVLLLMNCSVSSIKMAFAKLNAHQLEKIVFVFGVIPNKR